jgi:S1-C subfamily serine protease
MKADLKLNSVEFIDWADKYLNGELSIEETTQFENLLSSNNLYFNKIEQHQSLLDALALYESRKQLKSKLSSIHDQMLQANTDYSSTKVEQPALLGKVREINHLKVYVAAASVAVVVTLSIISGYNYFRTNDVNKGYKALRRDLEKIRKSQHAIIKNYNSNTNKEEAVAERFGGTGFVLSSEGLVVTSYHLIKGNDSVFIENNYMGRLKAFEIYSNPQADISILKIADKNFKGFGSIPYSFSGNEKDLGEKVFTLGYPREDVVYGEGAISSNTGFDGDSTAYQISIPVNPGNSGGPLVDDKGSIIGLISGKQTENEGVAFAIKSKNIIECFEKLKNDSSLSNIFLNKRNNLKTMNRVGQLKKLQEYVFVVKVFDRDTN